MDFYGYVTFGIAVAGFTMSLGTWLRSLWRSREKFAASVIDYGEHLNAMQLLVSVTNFSDNVLVITSISCRGRTCELEPKLIRGDPKSPKAETPRFPVTIPAQNSENLYLEFVNLRHIGLTAGEALTLEVQTIRKQVRKTVLLGNKLHYLNTRAQSQTYRQSQKA